MSDVLIIFKKAFIKVVNIEKRVSGFRTTGIFPLNLGVFCDEDFVGATVRAVSKNEVLERGEELVKQPEEVGEVVEHRPNYDGSKYFTKKCKGK